MCLPAHPIPSAGNARAGVVELPRDRPKSRLHASFLAQSSLAISLNLEGATRLTTPRTVARYSSYSISCAQSDAASSWANGPTAST